VQKASKGTTAEPELEELLELELEELLDDELELLELELEELVPEDALIELELEALLEDTAAELVPELDEPALVPDEALDAEEVACPELLAVEATVALEAPLLELLPFPLKQPHEPIANTTTATVRKFRIAPSGSWPDASSD
jgi:hypothetical protein